MPHPPLNFGAITARAALPLTAENTTNQPLPLPATLRFYPGRQLDVGHTERISLASRDEQNLLVVRYRDLKRCVETSFQELLDRGKKVGACW